MHATNFEKHRDKMKRPVDLKKQSEKFFEIMMDKSYDDVDSVFFYK